MFLKYIILLFIGEYWEMMSKNNKKRYQIPKISVTKFEMDKTIMESPTDAGDIVTFDSEY